MGKLISGASQADITPPVGVDLCGYGSRPGPSTGVHDRLAAGALYLANEDGELLLLACDLIGLHREQVAALRDAIRIACGIPGSHVMVGCSHTHAGPATPCIRYLGEPDASYLDSLHSALVQTAIAARNQARPATLGWAREPLSVGLNRRELRQGRIVIGSNAGGATRSFVDVLAVDACSGEPVARVFSHAAHAVALGADNTLVSADWPGAARRQIEATAPGAVALFLQGCCGDINCRLRGWDAVETLGLETAQAVARAVAGVRFSTDVSLGAAASAVLLHRATPPAASEAEAILQHWQERRRNLPADANRGVRRMADGAVEWAEHLLKLAQTGAGVADLPFEVQAMRIGEQALVALPGEVFVEYANRIEEASPFRRTVVAGYANGNEGYIPTASAFAEGGYEVQDAVRYYGTTMPLPSSERRIIEGARQALCNLANQGQQPP